MILTIVAICLVTAFLMAQVSTFFTTIYLHRGVTHQALTLHPLVAQLMHLELALNTGIVPREWAAVHRKHHRFSDQEGDPHSPYIEGLWKVLAMNVVLYKRCKDDPETVSRFAPHWKDDWIDKIPRVGAVAPTVGNILLGLAFAFLLPVHPVLGFVIGVATWWLNAGIYVVLNAMINSVCHKIGYRNFEDQQATNLQWVACITGGEGLHNNHHQFPRSARMKASRFEFDPAWPVIRVLKALRLAEYSENTLAHMSNEPVAESKAA